MKSSIGDYVRSPGYRPALRPEIRFSRENGKEIVTVHDPVRDRSYQLYENECVIARAMNGEHDLDDLTRVAKRQMPWATRSHVESLAIQIAGMGLLANVPPSMLRRTSTQIPAQPVEPELDIPKDYSDGLEDWTELSDGPIDPGPAPPHTRAAQMPIARPNGSAAPPIARAPVGSAPIIEVPRLAAAEASAQATPSPVEPPVAPAPTPAPVAAVAAPPQPAPSPAPPPAQAREHWEVEKPSFYARHKRLVYFGVFVAIVLALALIPYPLYITEPCTVRPVTRAEVRSQIEGVISKVLVKEGDEVKVGTPLAQLDDRDLVYAMEAAKANVDRLSATLDKVRTGNRPEEIRRAKALVQTRAQDVSFAAIQAKRQQKLFKEKVGSAAARDEANRVLAVKRSELSQALAELKLVESGSRTEEVQIAEAELKRAQAEVEFLTKKMELLTIRSPIAGRVLTPRFHERMHARVNAGDEVVEIGSSGDMLVEIHVDEAEADVIRIGQSIEVKVRSFPLEVFEGRVDLIAPAIVEDNGRRIVRVDARVDNSSGLLQPRMTGYAEIDAGTQTVLGRVFRRAVRWVRVRFLI